MGQNDNSWEWEGRYFTKECKGECFGWGIDWNDGKPICTLIVEDDGTWFLKLVDEDKPYTIDGNKLYELVNEIKRDPHGVSKSLGFHVYWIEDLLDQTMVAERKIKRMMENNGA